MGVCSSIYELSLTRIDEELQTRSYLWRKRLHNLGTLPALLAALKAIDLTRDRR